MKTLEEIQEKLNENIFDRDISDDFALKCYTRETLLKNNILRAFASVCEHIEKPGITIPLNHWQEEKAKRNVENLAKYIEILYSKLDKTKIMAYCENHNSIMPITYEDDEFIFLINSFYGNIVLDIMWASDISVSDVINITKGTIDNKNLLKKLPTKIETIENEIIPYLQNIEIYSEFSNSIIESIKSYKYNIFLGANLLVLVATEGLVMS